jgi:hypothetical protein
VGWDHHGSAVQSTLGQGRRLFDTWQSRLGGYARRRACDPADLFGIRVTWLGRHRRRHGGCLVGMVKGHIFCSRRPAMGLCNCDGFLLLFVELDNRHGVGSLALCHRGSGKSDTYPYCRCGARRRHGKIVPFAWIRHLDWFLVMAARLCDQRHSSVPACRCCRV